MKTRKDLVFNRSNRGKKIKYDEAMTIIEYSVMMVEFFEIKEFNNVIAGQLRLILCDTSWSRKENRVIDNSLIKKINPNPKLYPVKDFVEFNDKGDAFIPDGLFDYDKPMIDLDLWLKQVILKITLVDKIQEITIFEFIKESANKGGGAHVDSSLPEKSFIVDVHSERVLRYLARGLFRSVGRDFEQRSLNNLSHLITTFKEKVEASE
ncbi:hypothetical protein B4102_3557 [Heyndrickxia sporothermodurans]|uniref:Uncharacterized protein n=1 Tax=Heyndrickxia sporothermodurans TaxID=46224 RepID=A0A150KMF0_9BACI|nr:hypothetical protein [Heyndrickxia sporothermodurans]KYC96084.1 hypothetical protein B4102_3557 [Heyndrickxia sporothermodurans]